MLGGHPDDLRPLVGTGQRTQRDPARQDPVLDVVHRVGHVVGPVHDLSLQAPAVRRRGLAQPLEHRQVIRVDPELGLARAFRPRILRRRVQARAGQVQAAANVTGFGQFRLQPGEDAQGLRVALETSAAVGHVVQRLLAVVSERRMPDVVRQPGGVHQVGIGAQRGGDAPPDLRHLQRVGQPGARHVALFRADDLRLARQPAQRRRVQYPRPVPRERAAIVRTSPYGHG